MATQQQQRAATAIDALLGVRIRAQRESLGWTQADLARAIGLTYQQVQKYETGVNRISVARMLAMAEALGAPLIDLLPEARESDEGVSSDAPRAAGARELARLFAAAPAARQRLILDLARALGGAPHGA